MKILSNDDIDTIFAMREEGKTLRQIGKALGARSVVIADVIWAKVGKVRKRGSLEKEGTYCAPKENPKRPPAIYSNTSREQIIHKVLTTY